MVLHRRALFTIGIVFAVISATIAGVFYDLGQRNQEQTVLSLQQRQQQREEDYAKGLDTLRRESDRLTSDYNTACFEFQKLYALYKQSQPTSQYVPPDAARGNEDSCYR